MMKPLDTHIAHVDRQIQKQMTMSRNKFSKRHELFQSTDDERISRTGTIGRSESYQLYHKARDHLKSAKKRAKTSILDRYLEDERYRLHLQSEDITEEKENKWDRIVNGPKREHVPTEAEREHWKSTYCLKQTTAGGAGNTSTQPQTSSSQWQDWSGWQDWTNPSSSSTT